MDPITAVLIGVASLAGLGFATARYNREPFRWRTLRTWGDGWLASELLSEEALATVGASMQIPLLPARAPELAAGFRRFCLITKRGAPPTFAVLAVYDRIGSDCVLAEAWGVGMSKPSRPEQWQHVRELTEWLQRDIGRMVADMAMRIAGPAERYQFLKQVVRRPALAAAVVSDDDFASVVLDTTRLVHPERVQVLAQRRELSPIGPDMAVRQLPLVQPDAGSSTTDNRRELQDRRGLGLGRQPRGAEVEGPASRDTLDVGPGRTFDFDGERAGELAIGRWVGDLRVQRGRTPGFGSATADLYLVDGGYGLVLHSGGRDTVYLEPDDVGAAGVEIPRGTAPLAIMSGRAQVDGREVLSRVELFASAAGSIAGLTVAGEGELGRQVNLIETDVSAIASSN